MKWIVISDNTPAFLHAHLEAAAEFMPHAHPDVVFMASDQAAMDGYLLASYRLRGQWWSGTMDGFRASILQALHAPRSNGEMEHLCLFTTDQMTFTRKVNLQAAFSALLDKSVLGLDLVVEPNKMMERREFFGKKRDPHYFWNGDGPFDLGVVYRTSDVLWQLESAKWDSMPAMLEAVYGSPALRRRPKMVCLPEPAMISLKHDTEGSTTRYLNNEKIAVASLREDRLRWELYQGDE